MLTSEDRSSRYATQTSTWTFGENPAPAVPLNSNPYFEVDTSGWTANGCTFTQTAAYHHQGAAAGQLTPNGVAATPLVRSALVPVSPNTSYTGDAWLFSSAGWSSASVIIDWFDSTQTQIGTSPSTNGAVPVSHWALMRAAGTSPANAAYARIAVAMFGTPSTSAVLYIDEARLYLSSQGDEYPYADYATDHDPTYVFTQANLSRPDNSDIAPMVNAAAEATYGQRILTQTLQATTDFDVTQAGVFYLSRYSSPKTRITTLTLVPSANPALWPVVLGLEISQRVRVKRRSIGLSTSAEYYIEKIDHKVDAAAGTWTVSLQLSPVWVPSAWVLGDATRGVLGSTTTPIY
ncbi:hypothetical protein [Pseudonocardia sp. T1-2H]|uniref:hypothetical protein n=1 Tax=Pseudonocardia sp. T1-2H TaxID=3128899 RepID=UPI003100F44E